MKAEYRDNPALGPGHGFLILSQALMPAPPWQVALQRASDQAFISGGQNLKWVGETIFMSLDGEALEDGSLRLDLGPNIVNGLTPRDQYRITLKGSDGDPVQCRLPIDRITFSPSGSLDNTAQTVHAPVSPEPEPVEPGPLPEQPDMSRPEAEPAKARKWGSAAIAIPGLLICLCVAWWHFAPDRGGTGEGAGPGSLSAEEQVREFFSSPDINGRQAMMLAKKLPRESQEDQDAVYRLYYFGSEQKDPEASLAYGKTLDPSTPQWGTIGKDPILADQAYSQAGKERPQEAAAAHAHLVSWLEEQVKNGNSRARLWLDQIKGNAD